MIEFGHASHAGLRREHNEDTYWADAGAGLFLIADGMGGHGRGEVAAAIARDALVDAARSGRDFAVAARDAGASIAERAAAGFDPLPMGAAFALLQLDGHRFNAYRVGDSRILVWQQGRLTCIDADAVRRGETDVDETPSPRRHRITQALGITPAADLCVEPVAGALERGMQFLLCCDSLTESVEAAAIGSLLARTELAAQECVDQLILAALAAGGRDNLTAVLLRIA